jgi:hypothetical protein
MAGELLTDGLFTKAMGHYRAAQHPLILAQLRQTAQPCRALDILIAEYAAIDAREYAKCAFHCSSWPSLNRLIWDLNEGRLVYVIPHLMGKRAPDRIPIEPNELDTPAALAVRVIAIIGPGKGMCSAKVFASTIVGDITFHVGRCNQYDECYTLTLPEPNPPKYRDNIGQKPFTLPCQE